MNNNLQAQPSHALIYQTDAWLINMNHKLYLKAFVRKFEPRPCGPSVMCPFEELPLRPVMLKFSPTSAVANK